MYARGNVEVWLGDLLKEQMKSLHGVIRDAFRTITAPEFELLNFLNTFPAQVINDQVFICTNLNAVNSKYLQC